MHAVIRAAGECVPLADGDVVKVRCHGDALALDVVVCGSKL